MRSAALRICLNFRTLPSIRLWAHLEGVLPKSRTAAVSVLRPAAAGGNQRYCSNSQMPPSHPRGLSSFSGFGQHALDTAPGAHDSVSCGLAVFVAGHARDRVVRSVALMWAIF